MRWAKLKGKSIGSSGGIGHWKFRIITIWIGLDVQQQIRGEDLVLSGGLLTNKNIIFYQ
jgi:hypothetical protein